MPNSILNAIARGTKLNSVFSHQKKIRRGPEGTKILVPGQGDQGQNDPPYPHKGDSISRDCHHS